MRKLVTIAAIGALIVAGLTWLTVPASAATAHPRPAAAAGAAHTGRAACTSRYDWAFLTQLHNDEQGGYADWESNGCHFTMQTRVECTNVAGADYYHYSGEVSGLEIQTWATCNLFDTAAKFWIDPQDTGHWIKLAG